MAREYARLIILGGPDGGREILLDRFPARLGRAAQCEITFAEEFISREHLLFDVSDEGVVVEVLSLAGIRVGGRKYKKGKAILLGAGDVLELGTETEVLFVDVGSDTRSALAEAQAARQAAAEAKRVRASEAPAAPEPAVDRPRQEPAADVEATPAEVAEQERSRRTRRILTGLGVYLALLAAGAVALTVWTGNRGREKGENARPLVLTAEQIRDSIEASPEVSHNSQEAADALDQARQRFAGRHVTPGDSYRCVKLYLRYKALSGELGLKGVDQSNYQIALNEDLLPELYALYRNADLAAAQGRWHAAKTDLEAIRRIIPLQSDPIHYNVQRHLGHVKRCIARAKKSRRRGSYD